MSKNTNTHKDFLHWDGFTLGRKQLSSVT